MPTTLTAGDIAFTALQSDNSGGGANGDYFQFVLLTAVTTGTTIYFTDNGYRTDTSTFRTNETMMRWVAQSDLPAGTLISFTAPGGTAIASTAEWTGINPSTGAALATATLTLAAGGDNITALVSPSFGGAEALTGTAIAAITQNPIFAATFTNASGNASSALPPGLTDGVNAVSIATFDNSRYNGTTTGTASDLRTAINTDTNWTGGNTPLTPHGASSFTVTGGTPTLNITDVSLSEGDAPGTTTFTFTVTLTAGAPAGGVTFDIATADGTAQDDNPAAEDNDYVAQSLTGQTIAEGSTGPYQFNVTVNTDNVREGNETFFVNVTNITGATAGDTQGQGTIQDDDTPVLSIADVSLDEGNAGTKTFTFTVTLDRPAPFGGVTFDIATADGSATAGSDYLATGATAVTIPEGETSYTFDVTVNGDTAIEPDETFLIDVTNVTGASVGDGQATGTILNEDSSTASVAEVAIVEGDEGVGYLVFTVTLDNPPAAPVTFDYATSSGTATAGSDYLAVSGTVSFAAGETSKTISVPIIGDTVPEDSETLTLTLSNPSGGFIGDGTATGTITTDDGTPYFSLASGDFEQEWTDTSQISADDDWSDVPYIIGYRGDGLTDGTGTDPRTITGTSNVVDVIANQNNTSSISGGVAEFQLTDPTIGLQGSGTADAPYVVLHLDSTGRENITVSYRLRDLDGSGDNAVQAVAMQYRVGTSGAWTDVPAAYVADATTGPNTLGPDTLVSAELPADAANQPQLQVRIITTNAAGNDEWVGVDDIEVTSQPAAPGLSIANAAAVEGTGGSSSITFTVTRHGDSAGAVSADWTLSSPGGSFGTSTSDFLAGEPLSGTVNFADGETVQTITLDLEPDSAPEADEDFTITLSNPTGGTLIDASAIGTIVNDDGPPPLVSIDNVTQVEGDAGTTIFTFTVTRTGGTGAFSVDYVTTGGTATGGGDDYNHATGTLSFAAGENSKTIEVTVNGDTGGELAETFNVQLFNPTGFAVFADGTGTGTIQNDDILYIHDIQGTSYYSPILAGDGFNSFNTASVTTVVIQAVVTAVDNDGNRQGYYLQEQLADWDANPFTSEGIFVMTRNDAGVGTAVSGVNVGDLVTVTAQVMEYQGFSSNMPITALVNPSSPIVHSSGNSLPTLTLSGGAPNSIMTSVEPDYTDSSDDGGDSFDASLYALSYWETVEGMHVTIPNMVVADGFVSTSGGQPIFQAYSTNHADADQINSRGGYTIAGDPPNSPPTTADAEDDTSAGGRHLHDGDVNPDIIELDFSGFATDAPPGLAQQATMGDSLGNVTGIIEFDFSDRKLFVTDPVSFTNSVPVQETTTLGSDARALTVATFNVENLDPGDGQARFDALAEVIATNLNSPDIIMIEEMQDNTGAAGGTTDASLGWQMLVDALNAAVPGAAYQWVDQEPVNGAEGGEPGGNIRVGFLYDTNRVQLGDLAADATIAERRQYTDRIGDGVRDAGDLIAFSDDMVASEINTADWSTTRKSLLGQFTFNGNTIFLTANHFTAKGGSGEFWQYNQDLSAGQPSNEGWDRRVQQAEDVWHVLNLIQTGNPDAGVIAGGDFNDFYFYRPLEVVTGYVETDGSARSGGARFDNLTLTLSEAERYTYTFDGRSQAIDHIIASQSLASAATYDVVHINTGYNGLGTGADADPSLSDHDPGVASFSFRARSEVFSGTAGADIIDLSDGGSDEVDGLGGNDGFYMGDELDSSDDLDGGDGSNDQLILQGNVTATILANHMQNIEVISLLSGATTQFGDTANNFYDYAITMDDDAVDAGERIKIWAAGLRAGEALFFDGSDETDGHFTIYAGRGTDYLIGGHGNDYFFFGDGNFTEHDRVVGNGGAQDQLGLRGNYSVAFQDDTITGIDTIVLISGYDSYYGLPTAGFGYNVTTDDANVASGATLSVWGLNLTSAETMVFDGSNETDGHFRIFGGAAGDTLTGGDGNDMLFGALGGDTLTGGDGNDTFVYRSTAESGGSFVDFISDFASGDKIDLSAIDANSTAAGNQAFAFVGPGAFTGAGQVRIVDNGDGTWTLFGNTDADLSTAELQINLTVPLTPPDFIF
jgi:uncharacterized protein